jgi:hypothetical protein
MDTGLTVLNLGERVHLLARIGEHEPGTPAVVVDAHADGTYEVEVGSGVRLLVVESAVGLEEADVRAARHQRH